MKFRITIMQSQGSTDVSSDIKSVKNAFSSTNNFFGNSVKTDKLFKNYSGDGIIIAPEEITMVDFNISDFGDSVVSNTESDVTVRVCGLMLAHLEESGNSVLGIESLLSSYAGKKLNGVTQGLSQGIEYLGNTFGSSLSSTLTGMLGSLSQGSFNLKSLYNNNLKNTIELARWALEYGESTDYRDVVIETIINESVSKTYILPDMFAVKYHESVNVSSGSGFYEFLLKQKRYSNRKIQITGGNI